MSEQATIRPRELADVPADPLSRLRHSTAHVMADAVTRIRPGAKVAIGPAIDGGFYYDFDTEPFAPGDIERIEAAMAEIVARDLPFERRRVGREEAAQLFRARGERYKLEILDSIAESEEISLYQHGDFVDLCHGPHLERTGQIGAFKVLAFAGAYWRGDESKPQLQRVYGTAFATPAELEAHLARLEEAKRRDHRVLGKQLDLFSTDELVGSGFILWHPKGAILRELLETMIRKLVAEHGYLPVVSPHLAREELLQRSGHLEHYQESLFGGMELEGQRYLVKPMNCPFHVAIYRSQPRSYRDLPIRYAELGTVYRYERSGVLHGLLRVRGFTQDDAHLFVTEAQLADEMRTCIRFGLDLLGLFGFRDVNIFLATRPASFMGDPAVWDRAETTIREVLEQTGLPFEVDVGGGAFYGPKIDLKIQDALGREWQLTTFQVDFQLPQRFDLTYVAADGTRQRPVMIHRALLGSIERFIAILIEHHAGLFPLWLAPVQVRVLSVSEKAEAYAREVRQGLLAAGLRADVDLSSDKLGAKVRRAQVEKLPYMVVVGERDLAARVVSPRTSKGECLPAVALDELVRKLVVEAQPPRMNGSS